MIWFLDTETTGLNGPAVELAVINQDGQGWSTLISQPVPIEDGAFQVHGISMDECRRNGRTPVQVGRWLAQTLVAGDTVVCHNVGFDRPRVEALYATAGIPMPAVTWDCTLLRARAAIPGRPGHKLADLAVRFGFKAGGHRAMGDAMACRELYQHLPPVPVATPAPVASKPVVAYPAAMTDGAWKSGPMIIWGANYASQSSDKSYRYFEVIAVNLKKGWFIVMDQAKQAESCFRFDRFEGTIVDTIIRYVVL